MRYSREITVRAQANGGKRAGLRGAAVVASAIALVCALGPDTVVATGSNVPIASQSTIDGSGIRLVGPDPIQFRAVSAQQADAFDAALKFSLKNSADMGYPWFDAAANVVSLAPATGKGQLLASSLLGPQSTGALAVRVVASRASIDQLDAIADDATRLVAAGLPHADLIWMTEPDEQSNRVVITVSALAPDLLAALAARYGTDAIEVRLATASTSSSLTRDSDAPAFFGGAWVTTSTGNGCTTGFAWQVGTQSAMLTAAHCISTGGNVSYPRYSNVAAVKASAEENWSASTGTAYYTGQSVYRGDVALARYGSSYPTAAVIYSGAPHTTTTSTVSGKASRYSSDGDAVCINGVVTGEWCGMVQGVFINRLYNADGPNVWARHMIEALSLGNTCPTHGDSGAPAYRRLTSTSVAAVGILSGSAPLGVGCDVFFTDIWDAWNALPGDIKTY